MAKTFVVWVSQLDSRTTVICMDAHGQVVGENELFVTMSGSLQSPPAHWGCRSMLDVRTMMVRREVSFRDRRNSGRRFERTERRSAREQMSRKRKEIGRQRWNKLVERARATNPPPGVPYLSEIRSRGPIRLIEIFAEETGAIQIGAVRPPTTASFPTWKPTMTRAEAERWAEGSAIEIDLYHGTPATYAPKIREEGFKLSQLGNNLGNGGMMGAGHYFAPTLSGAYRGETLVAKVRANRIAYFGETDLRARGAAKYAARRASGDATRLADLTGEYASMPVQDLLAGMTDEYLDGLAKIYSENRFGQEMVRRQVLLDDGYDAIVWRIPRNNPANFPDAYFDEVGEWVEVALLRDDAIVVITG